MKEATTFRGENIVFANNLLLLDRAEAIRLSETAGAHVLSRLSSRTDLLVVGIDALESGGTPAGLLQRAHRMRVQRGKPRVMSELAFIRSVGAADALERYRTQYTPAQIGRILGVPPERLRKWIRRGFLKPSRVINRLPWFDFTRLAFARKLKELSDDGVTDSQIEKALGDLAAWFPENEGGLVQIEALFASPVVRLHNGSWADPNGQLVLDLEDRRLAANSTVRIVPFRFDQSGDPEEWFRMGVRAEDEGDLNRAVHAYQQALLIGGPDAEISFNLGNALFGSARESEAVQRYLQTVEIEPKYVEAWNNLAIALGALGRADESIDAFRAAVAIEPHYGDARYNLAAALEQEGRAAEAREHWLAYLEEDPESELADEVRRRLEK
jgi:DNA-binding transcriptional MerR regulator